MAVETVFANDPFASPVANNFLNATPNGPSVTSSNDATVAGYVAIIKPQEIHGCEHPVSPNVAHLKVAESTGSDPRIGTTVGNYYIKSVIASGGMGTVYKALQREPVRRTVALKMIRRGMADQSTIGRFFAERQALAVMDHPDIAQVFEADTADDGNPYFAMEFCTGEPIDRYCRNNRLDLAARLNLVIRIARAVQQAHSRGVIHRDLKPANVLVSPCEGGLNLKIIDFGIAKFTDGQWQGGDREATRIGELIGTPAYMSPEQGLGIEIDARTDVFAIGAILFKLLTDTTPLRANDQELITDLPLTAIIEQLRSYVPTTPSARIAMLPDDQQQRLADDIGSQTPKILRKMLSGDLDWIALRATESDRIRRYATANDLADDLQHFLNNEPVNAVAPSRSYRAKKFYQRNRIPVLAAGAITAVILISSAIATIGWWNYENERAEEQRRVAEEADILLNDAQALRRLAVKGGPDSPANFIAAEASLAKAESVLSGPHGLPHLNLLLSASRQSIADDRAALQLVQRLENARERAFRLGVIDDPKTFGPDFAITEISIALNVFGIRIGIDSPIDAATRLAQCPPAIHSQLIETLHFLIAYQHADSEIPSHLIATWANDVASILDQNEARNRVRKCILDHDGQSLVEIARLPVPIEQTVDGNLVLAKGLMALGQSSDAIGLLRVLQIDHPDNFWVNYHLGTVLSESREQQPTEESLRYLNAAVSLRPQSLGARVKLAEGLLRSGDQASAAKQLQIAIELAPDNQAIRSRLESLLATKSELSRH
jgi:serine/threonine protein kinase